MWIGWNLRKWDPKIKKPRYKLWFGAFFDLSGPARYPHHSEQIKRSQSSPFIILKSPFVLPSFSITLPSSSITLPSPWSSLHHLPQAIDILWSSSLALFSPLAHAKGGPANRFHFFVIEHRFKLYAGYLGYNTLYAKSLLFRSARTLPVCPSLRSGWL